MLISIIIIVGDQVPTLGLYSAFLAWRAIVLRSSLQSIFMVATMFWRVGMLLLKSKGNRCRWNLRRGREEGSVVVFRATVKSSTRLFK